ncbi:alcohol dehydrogenase catalytic domain-containing protein [Actinomycetes bacterium KLBMP 9759]
MTGAEMVSRCAEIVANSGDIRYVPVIAGEHWSTETVRSLIYVRKQILEWREVPDAVLEADTDALVRPFAVARCDLDVAFLQHDLGRPMRLGHAARVLDRRVLTDLGRRPFTGPFPFGHECVAEVVRTGGEVRSVAPGDAVIVPFQISCGRCTACSQGLTAACGTDRRTPISMYGLGTATGGWGGAMSDLLRVPHADHMLVQVPDGVDPVALASASDNIPDGWRSVAAPLARFPGAPVLVLGGQARSIGLYAAASALALGAERVDYVDSSADRLGIAAALGATPLSRFRRRGWPRLGSTARYPVVVDASGERGALQYALRSLAPGGICTSVALYFESGTRLPLWTMYVNQASFVTGMANARAELPAVVDAVVAGRLRPELVTRVVADWADAPQALLDPTAKVVVRRARAHEPSGVRSAGAPRDPHPA